MTLGDFKKMTEDVYPGTMMVVGNPRTGETFPVDDVSCLDGFVEVKPSEVGMKRKRGFGDKVATIFGWAFAILFVGVVLGIMVVALLAIFRLGAKLFP